MNAALQSLKEDTFKVAIVSPRGRNDRMVTQEREGNGGYKVSPLEGILKEACD